METKTAIFISAVVIIVAIVGLGAFVNGEIISLKNEIKDVVNNKGFSNIIEDMEKSVVIVRTLAKEDSDSNKLSAHYVDDEGKFWDYGTGFVIKSNETESYILTCHHIVDSNYMEVVLTGENRTEYQAFLYKDSSFFDLSIITVNVQLKPVKIGSSGTVRVGTKVAFTGYPLDSEVQSTNDGIVSFIGARNGIPTLIVNSFVNSGNSGGPVFLADSGEVVGVISARETTILPSLKFDVSEKFNEESKQIITNQEMIYNLIKKAFRETTQRGIGIAVPIDNTVLSLID